jgi:hypothetical protein
MSIVKTSKYNWVGFGKKLPIKISNRGVVQMASPAMQRGKNPAAGRSCLPRTKLRGGC